MVHLWLLKNTSLGSLSQRNTELIYLVEVNNKYTMYVTFASKCWRWPVHVQSIYNSWSLMNENHPLAKTVFLTWWPWPMTLTFKVDPGTIQIHLHTKPCRPSLFGSIVRVLRAMWVGVLKKALVYWKTKKETNNQPNMVHLKKASGTGLNRSGILTTYLAQVGKIVSTVKSTLIF